MGCYGQRPQYHINILPCIPDCETTLTYTEMVDYFNQMASGITCSGAVTRDEMVEYVAENCVASGVVTVSGISYEEMVQYVSENCTYSGVTYAEMVDYVAYVVAGLTISGVPSDVTKAYVDEQMSNLCQHFHQDLTTVSGDLHSHIEFLAFANQEFSGPTFTVGETWDTQWDGGAMIKETTVSGNC